MRTVGWKMLAEAPGLLASLVIWSMVYALLPGWARSVALVAAALLAAASQSRVGERLLTGLAVGARRPSRAEQATLADGITKLCEQRMGPPAIDVRVVRHPGWGVGAFGRRTLLVSREMIIAVRRGTLNQEEVDALLVAGVGMLRSGIVCWDGLIAAATLPWLPVRTVFAGVVQVMAWLPLVGFAYAVRRIPLATVGLLQYIAPTLQFLIGVLVFREPFDRERLIGFACIWLALAIFAADGLLRTRRGRLAPA